MKKEKILFILFILFILLILFINGCSSYKDCYDDCIGIYVYTDLNYTITENCLAKGYMCITKYSQDLKEFCFNECK